MKEPVDHILRPRLPWRLDEAAITECGYDASKVKTLTREDFAARLKDYGKERTAILTCMTCIDTAQRWGTWDSDPRQALEREIQWEHRGQWRHDDGRKRLYFELQAIAALVGEHQIEFDELVARLIGTYAWRETKAEKQEGRIKKRQVW